MKNKNERQETRKLGAEGRGAGRRLCGRGRGGVRGAGSEARAGQRFLGGQEVRGRRDRQPRSLPRRRLRLGRPRRWLEPAFAGPRGPQRGGAWRWPWRWRVRAPAGEAERPLRPVGGSAAPRGGAQRRGPCRGPCPHRRAPAPTAAPLPPAPVRAASEESLETLADSAHPRRPEPMPSPACERDRVAPGRWAPAREGDREGYGRALRTQPHCVIGGRPCSQARLMVWGHDWNALGPTRP